MTYFKDHYIMTEDAYPYKGKKGKCEYDESKATNIEVTKVYGGGKDRPSRIKAALA